MKETSVDNYLSAVRLNLGNLPDADSIVTELRAHIWDLANKISVEAGVSVNDAFVMALEQMEEPKALAAKFIQESGGTLPSPSANVPDEGVPSEKFQAKASSIAEEGVPSPKFQSRRERMMEPPSQVPETKISNIQFLGVSIIGYIIVLGLAAFVAIETKEPGVFIAAAVFGLMAISIFVFFLYFYDEVVFREQLARLRQNFQKLADQVSREIEKTRSKKTSGQVIYTVKGQSQVDSTGQPIPVTGQQMKVQFVAKDGRTKLTPVVKEPSPFWTFMEHVGGLIGFIFLALFCGFIVMVYMTQPAFFNSKWVPLGGLLVFVPLGFDMIQSLIQFFVGRIRATRLISAFVHLVAFICLVGLIIIFPFAVGDGILSLTGLALEPQDRLDIIANADNVLRIVMIVFAAIHFIQMLYDIFKFGAWKPTDRKSLL